MRTVAGILLGIQGSRHCGAEGLLYGPGDLGCWHMRQHENRFDQPRLSGQVFVLVMLSAGGLQSRISLVLNAGDCCFSDITYSSQQAAPMTCLVESIAITMFFVDDRCQSDRVQVLQTRVCRRELA